MLGKGLIKIVGFIVAGAIALAAGAELLSSVVSVVLSFRSGNPIPLLIVVLITVVLLRILQRQREDTPVRMIVNIAAYAATGYVVVVAFMVALPYGLVACIVASVTTAIGCSLLGDPSSMIKQFQEMIHGTTLGTRFDGLSRRLVPVRNSSRFTFNAAHNIILVDHSQNEKIIQLMQDRPLLPISLSHYEGCDTLFITTKDNSLFERVLSILSLSGIRTNGSPPPLLAEAIQMIPILDEHNGVSMQDYRLARDEKTVLDLLVAWPLKMTVFPAESGVMILVPESESTGLNVEKIKPGYESEILLNRDFTSLREVAESVETTA